MTNEKPGLIPEQNQTPLEGEGKHATERELSEDERQNEGETRCREQFIQEHVMEASLTPEQKVFVADYIKKRPGAWRHYNGVDFKVVEDKIEDGVWKISFGVFFDDYEAQRIEEEISLPRE